MNYIGKETLVEIGGKKYKLSRFTRGIVRQFMDWADKELGNPLLEIKDVIQDFPPNVQEIMVKDAMNRKAQRRSFHSPDVQALLSSPEGVMKLLSFLFQQHQPELSDDDVAGLYDLSIAEHGGEEYLSDKIAECAGKMPKDESALEREYLQEHGLLHQPEKKG